MRNPNRREFLKQALLGAASTSILGIPGRAAEPKSSKNERVALALVGAGGRGRQHLESLLTLNDVDVVAVCDVDDKSFAAASKMIEAKTGKKPGHYRDYRKLLENKGIDAVSIATPNHWHTLQAIWAMQAGKDAYVEKPISHDIWEGRKLVEAAEKYKRVVTQGSQRRSWPSHIAAIDFLHSGKLGKLKSVSGICFKPRGTIGKQPDSATPPGVDYDLWLGPAPLRPFNPNRFHYNWHWNWDYGNGEIGNTGVHDMDVIAWGIQKKTLPNRIMSLGGRFGYEDDGQTPNTQIAALEYDDLPVTYEVRGLDSETFRQVRVAAIFYCTEGDLIVANGPVAAFDPKGALIQKFGDRGEDAAHFRNFIDAVKTRNPGSVRVSPLEAHLGSGFCHLPNVSYRMGTMQPLSTKEPFGRMAAANEHFDRFRHHLQQNGLEPDKTEMRVGRELQFDPKQEHFVGDHAADQLLRREYRKPFVIPPKV